jgi:hypothetical protein
MKLLPEIKYVSRTERIAPPIRPGIVSLSAFPAALRFSEASVGVVHQIPMVSVLRLTLLYYLAT